MHSQFRVSMRPEHLVGTGRSRRTETYQPYQLFLPHVPVPPDLEQLDTVYLQTPVRSPEEAQRSLGYAFRHWLVRRDDYRAFRCLPMWSWGPDHRGPQAWVGIRVDIDRTRFVAGQAMQLWVNQGLRQARVLAVRGHQMLVEYEMPDGTTSLRILASSGLGPGKSVSYYRVTYPWLQAMLREQIEWIGRPQQTRPPGSVRQRFAAVIEATPD